MKVKTFRAQNMRDALAMVRRSFNGDAVILYTKSVRAPGLMGLFGRQIVEVAAATEVPREKPEAPPMPAREAAPAPRAVVEAYHRRAAGPDDQLKGLRDEIAGIRTALDDLVKSNCPPSVAGLPEPLTEAYLALVRHGVTEQLAADVARTVGAEMTPAELGSAELVKARMTQRLSAHVKVGGGIEIGDAPLNAGTVPMLGLSPDVKRHDGTVPESGQSLQRGASPISRARRVVALIGPTGVGKTTTIAKIAANFKVREHRRVALVTIDTYRIAAVQQLQTIADIIQVPLVTVLTVGDLKQALDDLRRYDLVLVDTAGRSQRDEMKMFDLDAFLKAAAPDETHLVVSAAASLGNMSEVVERFAPLRPTRLIVTKVDEAEALGRLVSLSSRTELPLSYVTTGQDIPNDIEIASAARVAAMAWER